jgi:excisionase family DNA binding protein
MAAVGNLNDYVKFQMAEGMTKGEGGGTASSAAQLGAGLAMGQQMAREMTASSVTPPTAAAGAVPPPIPTPRGLPDLLSPAEAANALGVNESDVMTALADGSLKGKKIGATWRIPRAAIDEFLKS